MMDIILIFFFGGYQDDKIHYKHFLTNPSFPILALWGYLELPAFQY